MASWQILVLICAASSLFIIWPLIKAPFLKRAIKNKTEQDQTQIELYKEHLVDLEASLQRGDIDEQQFEQLKVELQKTLLAEREQGVYKQELKTGGKKALIAFAVLAPIFSLFVYTQTGAKTDWEIYQLLQQLSDVKTQEEHRAKMQELAVMLQARIQQTPDNLQLQNLLAQSSMALQDYDQAVQAYSAILEAVPDSARTIANLAQAMFYRAGNKVTPQVREYTHKALELAPMMPEMLGLAGIDAKNQGDLRGAIKYWKRAVSTMNKNSSAARGYLNGIAKAEKALKDAGESLEDPPAAADDGASIVVNVALKEGAKVSETDTLFVYARAWQGAKMPLAIKRMTAGQLPAKVTLNEAMAMAPGMSITTAEQLEVVARISKSGTPAAKSGDWQGSMGPIVLDELQGEISIKIDQQVP